MATLTIPLADQYTVGGRRLFRFAQFNGLNVYGKEHVRILRENYHREIDSNNVVMLKPLARHIQYETCAILPKALSKMLKHELKTFYAEHLAFEVEAPLLSLYDASTPSRSISPTAKEMSQRMMSGIATLKSIQSTFDSFMRW